MLFIKNILINTKEFLLFGFISLTGLFCDIFIYYLLYTNSLNIYFSNFIASSFAITLVFILSNFFILKSNRIFRSYLNWVIYQFLNIVFFSYVVYLLNLFLINPMLSKIITIPITFSLNYIVMKFCLKK